MKGRARARRLLLAALVVAGCATRAPGPAPYDFAAHGRRVLVAPIELQINETGVGGRVTGRPEWSAAGQAHLAQALQVELSQRGVEISGDGSSQKPDFILSIRVHDHHPSAGVIAGRIGMGIVLVPVMVAFALVGIDLSDVVRGGGGPDPTRFASAQLEEFGSHTTVWAIELPARFGDVRRERGASKTIRRLLDESFPWLRQPEGSADSSGDVANESLWKESP